MTLRMTTETEHPSPDVSARLEDEGVADPDEFLTGLVHDVKDREHGRDRASAG